MANQPPFEKPAAAGVPSDVAEILAPGLYDRVVTTELAARISAVEAGTHVRTAPLPSDRSASLLSRHLGETAERILRAEDERVGAGAERAEAQRQRAVLAARRALQALEGDVGEGWGDLYPDVAGRLLTAVWTGAHPPDPPGIPLSESALLINEPGEPSLNAQLRTELESADRVDLICAFIQWNGVRLLETALERFLGRGGTMRVITSTYLQATQRKALDRLVALSAEVRVAYESEPAQTRLHAKAWLFHRNSGFHTAYIGSSNLSRSALIDGREWNVRLSQRDAAGILNHFQIAFERYLADPSFEPYDPARDGDRLDGALDASVRTRSDEDSLGAYLDVHPYPHQTRILEQLDVERERRGNWRNLVVAATGTGKTVVAAIDFERVQRAKGPLSLLFVAHQGEILRQARRQFRNVLRRSDFGELWVDGSTPKEWRHVFASVQSLNQNLELLNPEQFDFLIIDEMHHIAADSYERIMAHFRPRMLLGLSATPERMDGQNTLRHFGGRISAELRLWDALRENLLAPFHYFGLPLEDVDLSGFELERGLYRSSDLDQAYLDDRREERARNILGEVNRLTPDIHQTRALGFCVSVRHAEFMAEQWRRAGLAAESLSSETPTDVRRRATERLQAGELRAVFSVNLFNEGVDIPKVDTLLFLRPTASPTIFLQQLGRGLRRANGKSCVTVLDFIGIQNRRFRFDRPLRELTGLSLRELTRCVAHGFDGLPPGCHMELRAEARDRVLESLKQAVPYRTEAIRREVALYGHLPLAEFLETTGIDPAHLYRGGRTYTSLRRETGRLQASPEPDETEVGRRFGRLLGLDDPTLLEELSARLAQGEPAPDFHRDRRLLMLMLNLWPEECLQGDLLPETIRSTFRLTAIREELRQLLELLAARSERMTHPLLDHRLAEAPLRLHGRYSRDETLGAFGNSRPSTFREGVRYVKECESDLLLITLRKSDKHFTESTRYRDYFQSREVLHWESQSTTRADSPTGRRYRTQAETGGLILVFCREEEKDAAGRAARYDFLGPADYISHQSERPMQILWRLRTPIPQTLYDRYRAAAG